MNPQNNSRPRNGLRQLRYAMIFPTALLIASIMSSIMAYYHTRHDMETDLNEAMIALAGEKSSLWTRQDTVTALKQMHIATSKPAIYSASDLRFRNALLKDNSYYSLTLIDGNSSSGDTDGHKIASDSIILVPDADIDGVAIRLRGFADCSTAAVFASSNQTLPASLLALSLMSTWILLFRRKESETAVPAQPSLEHVRLTPMQRQLAQMLLEAPGRKLGKADLCLALWDGKDNAEESLYTLVRRTKQALKDTDIEIVCNRGESYELRIKP